MDGFSRCAGHSECFPRYCYLGSQNAGSAVAGKFYFSGRYFYFDRKNIFAFFADFSVGYENSNVNTGNCHSGKAAAGEKGKRFATPNSEILIHQPLIGGQGGGISGQATEIKIYSDHMMKTREKLNKLLSEKTGQPIEVINRDTERDNYMTAQEALEYGLIDGIMDKRR